MIKWANKMNEIGSENVSAQLLFSPETRLTKLAKSGPHNRDVYYEVS